MNLSIYGGAQPLSPDPQALTTTQQAQARTNIGAFNDSSPVATTSPLHTQSRPHAIVALDEYVYVWDRQLTIGCKINSLDFGDITYFTSNALSSVCYGGDGYIYGISEQGTRPLVRFDPADNTTTTVVAAPAIILGVGPSICADGSGNLYITSAYDANNTRVLKYTIGSWGAAAATKNIAKKGGHAIAYVGGAIWLTGYNTSTTNGWYAKLDTALTDIIAATDFAPGGGEVMTPTDDFAFDGTHLYFVSESAPVVTNVQMAKVNASSGSVTYYNMPGGVSAMAYTALWDGGTKIIIPQYSIPGYLALFDNVSNTFSSVTIDFFGPVNELVFAGTELIGTTYSDNGYLFAGGGQIAKIRLNSRFNYGPFFQPNGYLSLPTDSQITVGGDGSTGSLSVASISASSFFGTDISSNTLSVGVGVSQNAGLAHKRITTGSIAGGASALVTVAFDLPFIDTNYTAVATVSGSNVAATGLTVVKEESRTADGVTYRVLNNSGGALTGTLNVIVMHD